MKPLSVKLKLEYRVQTTTAGAVSIAVFNVIYSSFEQFRHCIAINVKLRLHFGIGLQSLVIFKPLTIQSTQYCL